MATGPGQPATLGRRLKDVTGARSRVQRRLLGVISKNDVPSSLEWHSFKKPTLQGGTYSISVSQHVKIPDSAAVDLQNEDAKAQNLTVEAPRFRLQPLDILSVYPPPLSTADLTILPKPGPDQGVVPWLALIVFEKDELAQKPGSLPSVSNDADTGSFKVALGDLVKCPDVTLPILKSPEKIVAEDLDANSVDVIFLSPSSFMPLVYDSYQEDGSLTLPNQSAAVASDISRYQYLVHTRKAPPDNDGVDAEEHSVIFSHRTATPSNKVARAVAVHLVTIEGWGSMKLGTDCSHPAVALISLHSWTYTVNPAAPPRFLDMLAPLKGSPSPGDILKIPNGSQLSDDRMLRYPSATTARLAGVTELEPETLTAMKTQMAYGYLMHKYRLPTREPTIALYRSPLTPVSVPNDIFAAPGQKGVESSFGKDLEIINEELGMVDITYSSAWNLGRLLAASNKDFCDALTRIRRSTLNSSSKDATLESRQPFAKDNAGHITAAVPQVWSALAQLVGSDKFASTPFTDGAMPDKRWRVTDRKAGFMVRSMPEMSSDDHIDKLRSAIKLHVHNLTSSRQESSKTDAELKPYNELNKPGSSTYPTVLKQVLDFKFLDTIPMNYLVPCSNFLPPESLRFFYIDANWIDAFVDGALSIGNTIDIDGTDPIKAEIKESLARYETTPIEHPLGRHKPQIPRYGFLIHSSLISTWPDVRFAAPFPQDFKGAKLEVLGIKRLASDVMMVLLDRCPEDVAAENDIPPDATDDIKQKLRKSITDSATSGGIPLLSSISIVQPPHHQSLVLGSLFDENIIKTQFVDFNITKKEWKRLDEIQFKATEPGNSIYDWKNSLIKIQKLRELLKKVLPSMTDNTGFKEVGPLLLALNLSSTIDSLRMANVARTHNSNNPAPPPPQGGTSMRMMSQQSAASELEPQIARAVSAEAPNSLVRVDSAVLAKRQDMTFAEVTFGAVHLRETTPTALQASLESDTSTNIAAIGSIDSTEAVKLSFSTAGMPLGEINQIPIRSGPARSAESPASVDLLIGMSIDNEPGTFFEMINPVHSFTIYLPLVYHAAPAVNSTGIGFLKSYASSGPRLWYKQQFCVDTKLEASSDAVPYPILAIVISSRWLVGSFMLTDLDGALLVLPQVVTDAPRTQEIYVMALISYRDGTLKRVQTNLKLLGTL